jgi:hypothetical protein
VDVKRLPPAEALGVLLQPLEGSLDCQPQTRLHCGIGLAWDDVPHMLEATKGTNARG